MKKYFYSWYILPALLTHEVLHLLFCFLTKTKINSFKLITDYNKLSNAELDISLANRKWKTYLIVYSPTLMLIPFILAYFSLTCFIISLYLLSTIIIQNKMIIWMTMPSISDLHYIDIWKYNMAKLKLSFSIGEIDDFIKNGKLNDVLRKINNPGYDEFIKMNN